MTSWSSHWAFSFSHTTFVTSFQLRNLLAENLLLVPRESCSDLMASVDLNLSPNPDSVKLVSLLPFFLGILGQVQGPSITPSAHTAEFSSEFQGPHFTPKAFQRVVSSWPSLCLLRTCTEVLQTL